MERAHPRHSRAGCLLDAALEDDLSAGTARELLDRGLAEIGLAASDPQKGALLQLATLLEDWAERINLTAHRTCEAIVHRLILDAAALSQCLPQGQRIADLGSGAGFPGLPLAILRPGSCLVLIEARERRHYFERAAIRSLNLANASARRGRVEGLPPAPHDLVVAQALAKPSSALELMLPWTAPGGTLAIPGAATPPEIRGPASVIPVGVLRYSVPCGGPARTVWLGRYEPGS